MSLPTPEPAQVQAIQRLAVRHMSAARRALNRGDSEEYAAAMAEADACQSWLDTYAPRRAA